MIQKNNGAKIVWHILEIANLLKKYGEVISQEEGITTQQWLILLHLANDPNIPYFERDKHEKPFMASELADALNVSRPNITNLLVPLIQKGLIIQIEDEDDRRKKRLKLALKGKELLSRMEPGRSTFNKNLFESLTEVEISQFLHYLESCNHTIIEHFEALSTKV